MNVLRQLSAVIAVVISLNAVRARAACRIEVNTDKDRVPVGVRDSHPIPESHEDVAVSRHDHLIAGGTQTGSESLGDVKSHCFFSDALTGDPSAIESSMAGVDHDRLNWHGTQIPDSKKGHTPTEEDGDQFEEKSAPNAR